MSKLPENVQSAEKGCFSLLVESGENMLLGFIQLLSSNLGKTFFLLFLLISTVTFLVPTTIRAQSIVPSDLKQTKKSSEHFTLEAQGSFSSTQLDAFISFLEKTWNESKRMFGFATESVVTVQLFGSQGGQYYGWGGRTPNTIELYVADLNNEMSCSVSLHEFGHMIFSELNFDTPLLEGFGSFFYIEVGLELSKNYGLEAYAGGINITKMVEDYIRTISSWTPGSIDAAVFLLRDLYRDSGGLLFGEAFKNCRSEFSKRIEYGLVCDFVRHFGNLTNKDYSPMLAQYGFDSANILREYVQGLRISSYTYSYTMHENHSILLQTTLNVTNLSIQDLKVLDIYRFAMAPDVIRDEKGPIPFNYTSYGATWYAGKVIIHLRQPVTSGQNFTITAYKLYPSIGSPDNFFSNMLPSLFANCSNLMLSVSLPKDYYVVVANPQPTSQNSHTILWSRENVTAYTHIVVDFTAKYEPPFNALYINTFIGICIAGAGIIATVIYRSRRKSKLSMTINNSTDLTVRSVKEGMAEKE